MKTVCKKLFCLMLVAMLLVSAVPAAFAEECDHTWDSGSLTTAPTCTTEGVMTYKCTKNAAHTKTETVAKVAHTWDAGTVTTPATCIATGVKTYTCSVCHTTKTEIIEKAAHTWDGGSVTTAATCYAEGVKTFQCTVPGCTATKTEAIAKLDHTWNAGAVTKAPTCTEKGVKTFTCTTAGCNATRTEELVALGHTWDDAHPTVTKAPTCTEKGEGIVKCTTDPNHTKTVEIPATGHNYGSDAICTVCGHGSRVYTLTFKYLNENGNWVTDTQDISNSETIDFPITPSVKGKRITGWANEKNATIYRTDSTYQWYVGYPTQFTAQYTETTDDNIATLTVWANFYVDGEYHHREQLLTKDFAKSSTSNSMFTWLYSEEGLTQVRDQVFAGGANSGYQWANQIYYNYFGDAAITEASMKADGDKHVYIKVTSTKSMEAKVMLYVHLKQTETVDRIIAMPGYTAGDYVSYSAVKSAVKTKYTGSNMTVSDLYTENEWDRLMDGQKASGAASVKVLDNGTTEIHVIVKNAKSSSSSTADPSNPKTGDYIIIAVGTMALAGAALVTMAELKKRKKI